MFHLAGGVAPVGLILALRRRRPWDGALFALSPALLVSATVNWDLLVVALTTGFLYAWAKRKPVLAGVLLGLAASAKFYPLFLVGPLLVLAIRSNRWRGFLRTSGAAVATWIAVNAPVYYGDRIAAFLGGAAHRPTHFRQSWLEFWSFNSERGIDWGTLWYLLVRLPGFGGLGSNVNRLNWIYFGLFLLACVGIAALALAAPRRPRLAQLAFLVIAAFLVFGKVWSQQYVLWLLPLAVLARPRGGAFLAWQFAEVCYFLAFYGELMGASGQNVFPEWVFLLAAALRLITVCVLMGFVVRDILHPGSDVVRDTYADDPDGGEFDGAPDAAVLLREPALAGQPSA